MFLTFCTQGFSNKQNQDLLYFHQRCFIIVKLQFSSHLKLTAGLVKKLVTVKLPFVCLS